MATPYAVTASAALAATPAHFTLAFMMHLRWTTTSLSRMRRQPSVTAVTHPTSADARDVFVERPHVEHETSARRIVGDAAAAQRVERGGHALAARHHHLGDLFLREIRGNLDALAHRAAELARELAQYARESRHHVVGR